MNTLQKHIRYFTLLMLAGAVLVAIGVWRGGDTILPAMGGTLVLISLIKILQYTRLRHDPEKVKQYDLMQNEERINYLASKSKSIMFFVTVAVEYGGMLVAFVIGKETVGTALACVAALQVFGYCLVYWYLSRKY